MVYACEGPEQDSCMTSVASGPPGFQNFLIHKWLSGAPHDMANAVLFQAYAGSGVFFILE